MIITKSNALIGVTPTSIIDAGDSFQNPAHITSADHSENYTSGSSTAAFTVLFGTRSNIEYVAISGHNAADSGNATITVKDGGTTIASATISNNNNVVISFTKRTFTDLRVEFTTATNTAQVTVSYITAGEFLTVPNNGEQSGYSRQWLSRSLTQRTTSSLNAAPVAMLQRRKPLKGKLNIPNATSAFSQGEWQTLIDFVVTNPFFIREVDSLPESSYICFDPKLDTVKAHGQTRALDSLSLNFNVYNGL
jgi:hypothetical protein